MGVRGKKVVGVGGSGGGVGVRGNVSEGDLGGW